MVFSLSNNMCYKKVPADFKVTERGVDPIRRVNFTPKPGNILEFFLAVGLKRSGFAQEFQKKSFKLKSKSKSNAFSYMHFGLKIRGIIGTKTKKKSSEGEKY